MVKFQYVEDKQEGSHRLFNFAELLEKNPNNKLKTFFDGILKLISEKEISSFNKIISYLEVDSGIELVNGELEALKTSLKNCKEIEINGDEIRKVPAKKIIKSNGGLKNTSQIEKTLHEIKADIKDSKKEIYDKVIALKNDIFDLRTEVKFNQERINELISVCYNAINTNPNVRFKKK